MSKVYSGRGRIVGDLSRRAFIAGSAAAGALAASGCCSLCSAEEGRPDIAAAHGPDVVKNVKAVVEAMGGMGAFVGAGQVVNILPNAQGSHPGASTDAVLVRAVVEMCKEAGAKEVRWLTWMSGKYWERSNIANLMRDSGTTLVQVDDKDDTQWEELEVPRGAALEKIRVFKALWECDVFISLPIIKDHIGSRFTGVLKNYMGTSHPSDNRLFHPTFEGENLVHMEQCIADLNTVVRPPDLCIGDAMTILTTRGPFGPGEITKPQRVFAAVDRVAFDSYGATILGLKGTDIAMIRNAHAHGLGEIDLKKVTVRELEVA